MRSGAIGRAAAQGGRGGAGRKSEEHGHEKSKRAFGY